MTVPAAGPVKYLFLMLEKKTVLTAEYLSLTRNMKDAFIREKEVNLKGFLAKRQECLEKIEKIDLALKKIKHLGAGELSQISQEMKAKLNGCLQRIKGLLEEAAPLDAEVMAMVREESRGIKAELDRLKQTRQAAKGYGSREKHIPRYVDARG